MKPGLHKVTHAAAAVFGILLALALLNRQHALSGTSAGGTAADGKPERRHAAGGPGPSAAAQLAAAKRAIPQLRSSEYQKAWDAIVDQSLPAQQRYFLQIELLRQWAEVDLEGALIAAFDTSWDGNNGMGLRGLLQAFDAAFMKRPTESWDLITSGRFGLGATIAKGRWAEVVVKENPLLVANSLRQIPYHTRRSIFPQVLAAIKEDPSKIGAFYDKLAELPQDNLYRDMVAQSVAELGARGSLEEIRGKFLGATTEAQHTLLVHELGKSLAGTPVASLQGELAQIPEEHRGRILRSVVFHAELGGENTPQLMGMILQAGEFKEIRPRAEEHMRAYASTPERKASLAAWAVNLPKVPDASTIIHRSVGGYVANDPQGARAWLDSVPALSWGKNNALAEYSQQMLWKHSDAEASSWALDQISDPKLRQEATNWRASWEKKNGKR